MTTALAAKGHNQPPDYAIEVTDRMAADYAELAKSAAAVLDEARSLPETVNDEAELRRYSDVVVRMRDTVGRAEGARVAEKEPFLRASQAVDGFFSTLKERVAKGMGVLTKRVNDYQQRKLAEERERRRLEAEATARIERETREAAAKAAAAAEEARAAAERARKPEIIEAKAELATQAEKLASDAASEAALASQAAEAAHIDTLRKPAEIARSRFDEGRLVTMKQVGYVEILDKMALDPVALWPFIREDAALQAVKAWAKTNSFKRPMAGAVIELRDESVIR